MNVNRIALAIAGLILPAALLPAQTPVPHVRTICVKVAPGKAAEYNAYLRDISVKLLRARVDDGELVGADVLRSVEPVGTSARCDYLLVWEYNGFPGEMNTADRTNALLKKLGMKMTAAELAAKRDSLSTLVGMEIWRNVDMVPADEAKGGYLRLNLYKTKPGKADSGSLHEGWQRHWLERLAHAGTGRRYAGLRCRHGRLLPGLGGRRARSSAHPALGKSTPQHEHPRMAGPHGRHPHPARGGVVPDRRNSGP